MGFKSLIKSSFWGRFAISELHCFESWLLPKLVDDETAVKRFYKKMANKELDLNNPQGLNEKMNWYKLNARNPLMQQCADKYAVRDYVTSKGYGDCLNGLLAVYNKVADIHLDELPDRFVLKAAHGSHMNIIVNNNKHEINWFQQRLLMRTWLKQDIYWSGREWVYKDIPRRIIAEEYLEDDNNELVDYKFFCFNGVPCFMYYAGGRKADKLFFNFYDMDMNFINVSEIHSPNNPDVEMPISRDTFEKMKTMAKDLSKPFQEVRVDFYVLGSKIYFGEMTFFSGGGFHTFEPKEYDKIWGDYWKIEK